MLNGRFITSIILSRWQTILTLTSIINKDNKSKLEMIMQIIKTFKSCLLSSAKYKYIFYKINH